MKRHGDLWDTLVSFPHLYRSAVKARRRKSSRDNVRRLHFLLEPMLLHIQDALKAGTWQPGEYRQFRLPGPKPRLISAAPFRDRIVHHALCSVLEPIWERTFIHHSYACRKGKGTHAAVDQYCRWARTRQYALKADISKYFASIDHELLKGLLARKIKDRRVLELAGRIIDHSPPQEDLAALFPDDPLWQEARRRGLPLGNQTSQFFANVYLDPFDHFVKQTLRQRAYLRYVDDFVIVGRDRRELAGVREACATELLRWRLRLHPHKSTVMRTVDGLPLLGYRVWPTGRRLPRAAVVRMRRRLREMARSYRRGECGREKLEARWAAWWGHARQARTLGLRRRLLDLFRDELKSRPPA